MKENGVTVVRLSDAKKQILYPNETRNINNSYNMWKANMCRKMQYLQVQDSGKGKIHESWTNSLPFYQEMLNKIRKQTAIGKTQNTSTNMYASIYKLICSFAVNGLARIKESIGSERKDG